MSHQITIWKITVIYGCLSQAACNFRQNDHRWSRFANQNTKISQMITNYYSKANQKIVQSQTRSRPVKNHEKSNTRSNSDRFQVINKYVSAQSHAQNLEKSMSNQLKSPKFQKFHKMTRNYYSKANSTNQTAQNSKKNTENPKFHQKFMSKSQKIAKSEKTWLLK